MLSGSEISVFAGRK